MRSTSMGVADGGKAAQHVDDALIECAGQGQLRLELAQGELVGQDAVPEQVGGLLEGRVLGQLVNVDAPIGQHARFSVDPADAGVRCDNSFQTLSSDSSRHSLWNSPLAVVSCAGCDAAGAGAVRKQPGA